MFNLSIFRQTPVSNPLFVILVLAQAIGIKRYTLD